MQWIHNNWRTSKDAQLMLAHFIVKRTDVLWKRSQDKVFAEIADILGMEQADTNTPNWFSHRMVAMKNIIERMSSGELAELDKEVAAIAAEGYSEAEKRQ